MATVIHGSSEMLITSAFPSCLITHPPSSTLSLLYPGIPVIHLQCKSSPILNPKSTIIAFCLAGPEQSRILHSLPYALLASPDPTLFPLRLILFIRNQNGLHQVHLYRLGPRAVRYSFGSPCQQGWPGACSRQSRCESQPSRAKYELSNTINRSRADLGRMYFLGRQRLISHLTTNRKAISASLQPKQKPSVKGKGKLEKDHGDGKRSWRGRLGRQGVWRNTPGEDVSRNRGR